MFIFTYIIIYIYTILVHKTSGICTLLVCLFLSFFSYPPRLYSDVLDRNHYRWSNFNFGFYKITEDKKKGCLSTKLPGQSVLSLNEITKHVQRLLRMRRLSNALRLQHTRRLSKTQRLSNAQRLLHTHRLSHAQRQSHAHRLLHILIW